MAAGLRGGDAAPEIERRTIAKVSRRLPPLIVVIYFVAYMDRTNVGFASFGLNRDFGFSATVYGWAGRHLLPRLRHLRSTEQRPPGARRGAALDRPDQWSPGGWWRAAWPSSPARRASSPCASCWAWPRPASSPA
ncbi:hypothetical protein ACU4GA_29570 [Methylobacterium oryzae CBMB20]